MLNSELAALKWIALVSTAHYKCSMAVREHLGDYQLMCRPPVALAWRLVPRLPPPTGSPIYFRWEEGALAWGRPLLQRAPCFFSLLQSDICSLLQGAPRSCTRSPLQIIIDFLGSLQTGHRRRGLVVSRSYIYRPRFSLLLFDMKMLTWPRSMIQAVNNVGR